MKVTEGFALGGTYRTLYLYLYLHLRTHDIPESLPPAAHAAAGLLSAEPFADSDAPHANTMPMYEVSGFSREVGYELVGCCRECFSRLTDEEVFAS